MMWKLAIAMRISRHSVELSKLTPRRTALTRKMARNDRLRNHSIDSANIFGRRGDPPLRIQEGFYTSDCQKTI
jgi:hypothetical protein